MRDVGQRLARMGVEAESIAGRVVLNPSCLLTVPRMAPGWPGGPLHPMNDGGFHLEVLRPVDVFTMPFDKNVGLLLPHEIVDDTPEGGIVMACQLLDPCGDAARWYRPRM